MAAHTGTTTWLEAAFQSAKEEFLASLTDRVKAKLDVSKLTTADDVYNAADDIQKQQAKTKTFRGLKRIEPLIKALQEYSGVADTYAQIKPEILCLIWGSLKFLLQAASALAAAFEKIVRVLGEIGLILPSFKQYAALFPSNDGIRQALCLFFEDILNFYAVLLNFVTSNRLSVILESFWPRIRAKIDKIQENIEDHKTLLTVNVNLEDISRAQRARKRALEEYDHAAKFRDQQTFSTIRDHVRPENYDERLGGILQETSKGSGTWLDKQESFIGWLNPVDRTVRCIWLNGIPGAGKTYLAGNVIERLRRSGSCVLFAFISHDQQSVGRTLAVLKSLLFQALEAHPSLRSLLPDAWQPDHTKLARDHHFLKDLLCKVLTIIGPAFLVLDGLDEIEEVSWRDLLSTVLEIRSKCVETKILISSRDVRGIARMLEKDVVTVRVDEHNNEDIQLFVRAESGSLLLELEYCGASRGDCSAIRAALESIAEKSEGMFLYAKLVLLVVKDYRTLSEIQSEVQNLPQGLNQAYGRLISKIEGKTTTPKLREVVRNILMWVACAARPLREEELLQILAIDIGKDDFTRGRKDYRDIRQACGPIIEVANGAVRFVHFSAKEYLLDEQSNHFMNLADAHLKAALICLTYLSYSSLDILFPETDEISGIDGQILEGDFVLLEYAVLEHMEHIKGWMRHKSPRDPTETISAALNRLFDVRGNAAFDESAPSEAFMGKFAPFQDKPALQRSLASAASFLTGARIGMIEVDGKSTMITSFYIYVARFRQHLEDIACDDPAHGTACPCQTLGKLYGPRRYHCRKLFCSAYVSGLITKEVRDWHVEGHSRNFKCPESDCVFASTGFRSSLELSRHTASAHQGFDALVVGVSSSSSSNSNGRKLSDLPQQDQQLVVEDAVTNSELAAVQQLILVERAATDLDSRERFISSASTHSTPELLAWLLDSHPAANSDTSAKRTLDEALGQAIDSENLPNIKLLLSRGADIMALDACLSPTSAYPANLSPLHRALRRWNGDLMGFLVRECGVTLPPEWPEPDKMLSPAYIFGPQHLARTGLEEVRRRFAAWKPYVLWPEAYKFGTRHAAGVGSPSVLRVSLENGGDPNKADTADMNPLRESVGYPDGVSVEMAKILLEFGADPNSMVYTGRRRRGSTALHWVAQYPDINDPLEQAKLLLEHEANPNLGASPLFAAVVKGNAELAKLLLQYKADPYPQGEIKAIYELNGMKKVEKYFGAPWKDIVRRIQEGEDLEGGQRQRRI